MRTCEEIGRMLRVPRFTRTSGMMGIAVALPTLRYRRCGNCPAEQDGENAVMPIIFPAPHGEHEPAGHWTRRGL
jgi:hypothetical protein